MMMEMLQPQKDHQLSVRSGSGASFNKGFAAGGAPNLPGPTQDDSCMNEESKDMSRPAESSGMSLLGDMPSTEMQVGAVKNSAARAPLTPQQEAQIEDHYRRELGFTRVI